MWNRPELRSIYFYEWNQQINFSNYGRETLTRFTFSGSTKCHSSKQLSPRSQVPVSIPTAQLPHVTAELSQHALWLRLQTQFLYYIRGEGMLMARYSKYNEKKKMLTESWKAGSQPWGTTWGLCNSQTSYLCGSIQRFPQLCTESTGRTALLCFFRLIMWSKQGVCRIFSRDLWALLTNQGDDGLSTFPFHFCLGSQD